MAFKLDDNLLVELGLAALPVQEKRVFLGHILETLEMRVGTTLAAQMSETQLTEFEKLMPTETDTPEVGKQKEQQALQWLEANFPHYKEVVNTELEKLKAEIKQTAPQILAASQQQAAQTSGSQAPYMASGQSQTFQTPNTSSEPPTTASQPSNEPTAPPSFQS